MDDLNRMFFRLEKFVAIFLVMSFLKFEFNQWQFWLVVFMFCFVLDKLEESIRREYDDTTKDRLKRLMEETYDGDFD